MNGYQITSIDAQNSIVYADMTYNGSVLHDRVVVSDVTDPTGIQEALTASYQNFVETVTRNLQAQQVTPDVKALIGQAQEVQ